MNISRWSELWEVYNAFTKWDAYKNDLRGYKEIGYKLNKKMP